MSKLVQQAITNNSICSISSFKLLVFSSLLLFSLLQKGYILLKVVFSPIKEHSMKKDGQCIFLVALHQKIQNFITAENIVLISSVRSSYSHPDLLLTHQQHPLFQITPVLNTGLSLSEPLELYKGYNAI